MCQRASAGAVGGLPILSPWLQASSDGSPPDRGTCDRTAALGFGRGCRCAQRLVRQPLGSDRSWLAVRGHIGGGLAILDPDTGNENAETRMLNAQTVKRKCECGDWSSCNEAERWRWGVSSVRASAGIARFDGVAFRLTWFRSRATGSAMPEVADVSYPPTKSSPCR